MGSRGWQSLKSMETGTTFIRGEVAKMLEQEAFELSSTHGHTKVKTTYRATVDEKGQGTSIKTPKLKI